MEVFEPDYQLYRQVIKDQVIASTQKDSQGEKRTKSFLEKLISLLGNRFWLGQQHDPSSKKVGFLENFRLQSSNEGDNEWDILADVHLLDSEELDSSLKGFSWSFTEMFKKNEELPEVCIYLPFPYYNDETFVEEILLLNSGLAVGKWYKKSADPNQVALIVTLTSFVLAPLWDKIFKEKVYPSLKTFIENISLLKFPYLNYHLNLRIIDKNGNPVNIYFITLNDHKSESLKAKYISEGLAIVEEFINSREYPCNLIKLLYNANEKKYFICEVEFKSGKIEIFNIPNT